MDAHSRCISYLTIELGAIPEAFRPLMGNRIYGCDDCLDLSVRGIVILQLTDEADFSPRKGAA